MWVRCDGHEEKRSLGGLGRSTAVSSFSWRAFLSTQSVPPHRQPCQLPVLCSPHCQSCQLPPVLCLLLLFSIAADPPTFSHYPMSLPVSCPPFLLPLPPIPKSFLPLPAPASKFPLLLSLFVILVLLLPLN